jgi:NDP-sugar pyrophosphorylase family protein
VKAVILSAGMGTRLRPLTNVLPKPLMPVVGRPIIENIIHGLKHCGIVEIAINTHHLGEKIVNHLGDGRRFEIKIQYSHEPQILGTGGGIGSLRDFLQGREPFIVHNGDILTDLDLSPVIRFHLDTKALATLVLCDFAPINTVALGAHGEVTGIRGTSKEPEDSTLEMLTFAGISVMSSEILRLLPSGGYGNIIDTYVELMRSRKGSIRGYVVKSHQWRHISTVLDYFEIHHEILMEKRPILWGKPLLPRPFYIGEGSEIEEGVELKGFVSAGRDCLIKRRALLENCIIWDGATVEEGEVLRNVIIGKGVRLPVKGYGTH